MRIKWSRLSWLIVLSSTSFFYLPDAAGCQTENNHQPEIFENSVGMQLVKILPGDFVMGSPESEPERFECEHLHKVRITRPFWIGLEEVSIEQFTAVSGRTNPKAIDNNHPESHVSWHDAEAFCRKLSELESKKNPNRTYRLPTEAEWEYACRAGTQTAYFWGVNPDDGDEYAWSLSNSSKEKKRVGSRRPNPWGLHDMNGSLWEWCSDWYGELPTEEQSDPLGPSTGEQKTVRGGSLDSSPGYLRSASRAPAGPAFFRPNEGHNIGFRVVMVEPEPEASESKN